MFYFVTAFLNFYFRDDADKEFFAIAKDDWYKLRAMNECFFYFFVIQNLFQDFQYMEYIFSNKFAFGFIPLVKFYDCDEIKRIQTFPDNYKIEGNFKDQWRQIGNAVPPLLSSIIANKIKKDYF